MGGRLGWTLGDGGGEAGTGVGRRGGDVLPRP